jgi:hypothetical protein
MTIGIGRGNERGVREVRHVDLLGTWPVIRGGATAQQQRPPRPWPRVGSRHRASN